MGWDGMDGVYDWGARLVGRQLSLIVAIAQSRAKCKMISEPSDYFDFWGEKHEVYLMGVLPGAVTRC
jgi:hypothetical protein